MNRSSLSDVIARLAPARITVVGDVMLDGYVAGRVERVSPEAPICVLEADEEWWVPGGAANVARNVLLLGAEVTLVGRVGEDSEGERLLELLRAEPIDLGGLVRSARVPTTTKTRFVAAGHQMLRVDREVRLPLDQAEEDAVARAVRSAAGTLVISDHGKGTITPAVFAAAQSAAKEHGHLLVDPAPGRPPESYRGASLVTPNLREGRSALGTAAPEDPEAIAAAYSERCGSRVLLTLGAEGAVLAGGGEEARRIPAHRRQVYDVTGAGDTTLAVAARVLAGGGTFEEAALLGMLGGALAVSRFGTATVSLEDLALAALSA